MQRISFTRILLYFGWLPILLAGVAMAIQALRITGRATEFVAVGKVIVGASTANPNPAGLEIRPPQNADVYGTQVEILESGELRRRALERVRATNPELKEIDVEIRVTQTKGSAILNVAAVGEDGKYTRVFLNALLDEYVAFRKEMIEKSLSGSMNKVIEEVLAREKQIKKLAEELDRVTRDKNPPLLEAEQARLVAKVSALRGEAETLGRSVPGADPQAAKLNLDTTRQALEEAETNLAKVIGQLVEIQSLRRQCERANQDYQDWKKTLERMDVSSAISYDPVAIMERPVVAVETEPDLVLPLVVAGVAGGGIGFLLMIVLGLLMEARIAHRGPPPLP